MIANNGHHCMLLLLLEKEASSYSAAIMNRMLILALQWILALVDLHVIALHIVQARSARRPFHSSATLDACSLPSGLFDVLFNLFCVFFFSFCMYFVYLLLLVTAQIRTIHSSTQRFQEQQTLNSNSEPIKTSFLKRTSIEQLIVEIIITTRILIRMQ